MKHGARTPMSISVQLHRINWICFSVLSVLVISNWYLSKRQAELWDRDEREGIESALAAFDHSHLTEHRGPGKELVSPLRRPEQETSQDRMMTGGSWRSGLEEHLLPPPSAVDQLTELLDGSTAGDHAASKTNSRKGGKPLKTASGGSAAVGTERRSGGGKGGSTAKDQAKHSFKVDLLSRIKLGGGTLSAARASAHNSHPRPVASRAADTPDDLEPSELQWIPDEIITYEKQEELTRMADAYHNLIAAGKGAVTRFVHPKVKPSCKGSVAFCFRPLLSPPILLHPHRLNRLSSTFSRCLQPCRCLAVAHDRYEPGSVLPLIPATTGNAVTALSSFAGTCRCHNPKSTVRPSLVDLPIALHQYVSYQDIFVHQGNFRRLLGKGNFSDVRPAMESSAIHCSMPKSLSLSLSLSPSGYEVHLLTTAVNIVSGRALCGRAAAM